MFAPAPKESWWRRLVNRLRGRPPRGADGNRYRHAKMAYRRSLDLRFRIMRIGAALGSVAFIAGTLGIAGVNPVRSARNLWHDTFPSYTRITDITAASAPEERDRREYAASFALDGAPDSAWAAGWTLAAGEGPAEGCVVPPAGGGADAGLLLTFAEATDLDRLEIQVGLPQGDPDRANQWRPTRLELRYDDGECEYVDLGEKPGIQRHDIDGSDTTTVRLTVLEAVPPTSGDGDLVSFGEVRLYRQK